MNQRKETPSKVRYLQDFTSRKENGGSKAPDSLQWWMEKYLDLVIRGVRPDNVTKKIELQPRDRPRHPGALH
jgi:hypothetical protein